MSGWRGPACQIIPSPIAPRYAVPSACPAQHGESARRPPVDQPGSWHLLSRYQPYSRTCQPRANPWFCCTPMHAPPRSRPVLRCPGAANHHDPVMTSYLPLTCLAATLARVRVPGLARQPAHGPVPLEPAEAPRGGSLATAASDQAPRFALRQRCLAPVQKFSHRDHGSPPMTLAYVRRPAFRRPTRQSPESGGDL